MISKSYTLTTNKVTTEQYTNYLENVSNWKNIDSRYAAIKIDGPFKPGAIINFTVLHQNIQQTIEKYIPQKEVVFSLKGLFGTTIYNTIKFQTVSHGTQFTITLSLKGPFTFLWGHLYLNRIKHHSKSMLQKEIDYASKHY